MSDRVKAILLNIISVITIASMLLRNIDSNTTGKDDKAADLIDYFAQVLQAFVVGNPIPQYPPSLKSELSK